MLGAGGAAHKVSSPLLSPQHPGTSSHGPSRPYKPPKAKALQPNPFTSSQSFHRGQQITARVFSSRETQTHGAPGGTKTRESITNSNHSLTPATPLTLHPPPPTPEEESLLAALKEATSAEEAVAVLHGQAVQPCDEQYSESQGTASHPQVTSLFEHHLPPSSLLVLSSPTLARLLNSASTLGICPTPSWRSGALHACMQALRSLISAQSTPSPSHAVTLASLLWGVSEIGCDPEPGWLEEAAGKVAICVEEGCFMAGDLATVMAALGGMGYQPTPAWGKAIVKEASYQLSEFSSDLTAPHVARLISGWADLGLAEALDGETRRCLMKAVYGKTKTVGDKAAVDFALAKLDSDKKSMHYDTRWTHEELSWLPRRERDKRRIMKEGWYRTQWGGWAPGRG